LDRRQSSLLPTGKLEPELLQRLLEKFDFADASVVQGPALGVDVALLDTGGPNLLVAKTDPITFATDAIGYYAVVVSSNDIATCGGVPRWMLTTVLLPEGQADEALADDIFSQLAQACRDFGILHVGGHTEVTYNLDRPLVVGMMLGEVARDGWVTSAGARAGDVVLMTKAAPLEGTSILARELGEELLRRGFETEFIKRCAAMLFDPGLSVLREAQAATKAGGVHAMHDPTEGGVATGLWEIAMASGKQLVIDADGVPLLEEGQRLGAELGLDPLGLIASGSLVLCVAPDAAEAVAQAIRAAGVPCRPIGRVEDGPAAVVQETEAGLRPVPRFDQDEVTRVL